MNKKCVQCQLVNFPNASACARCNADLVNSVHSDTPKRSLAVWFALRAGVVAGVCLVIVSGFYISLITSATRLTIPQRETVHRSIALLGGAGFEKETMLLSYFTAFRASDNWLNASVAKENAYAATNFPFMIVTVYPDFFTYPVDDVEKAAILLHEARHLMGEDEKDAYAFVWKNRARLGWERSKYARSPVWLNIREQTREHVPELFVCPGQELNDCTEQ